jgi:hypothetical protein
MFDPAFFARQYDTEEQEQQRQQLLEEKMTPAALHDVLLVALSAGRSGSNPVSRDPVRQLAFALLNKHVQYPMRPCDMLPELQAASVELRDQLQPVLRQLQPAAQQQLLELAIMRGHVAFVDVLQKHLRWQMPQAAVMAAMQRQIAAGDHRSTQRLAVSEAARQLTVGQLAELMHAAVQQRQHDVLDALFGNFAASELNREHLDRLLDAACELQSTAALDVLAARCNLCWGLMDAAIGTHDSMMKWLRAAVQLGSPQALTTLCRSVTSERYTFTTAVLSDLFQHAVQLKQTAVAAELLMYTAKLPSYHERPRVEQGIIWPNAPSVSAYLELAIEEGCSSAGSVCSSKHCKQLLSAAEVFGLLERAIESSSCSDVISGLCVLSSAQQLQPDQAVTLLLQALQCDNTTAVSVISRRLPGAKKLAMADNLQALLQAAAVRGLFNVSAANAWFSPLRNQLRQLPQEVIEHTVQLALITLGARSAVFQGLLVFLQGSVQWLLSNGRCYKQEIKQWEADAVARLLVTAVQIGDLEAVCMLCKVPAADRIGQDSAVQLLHAVLAQQQWQQALPSLQKQQEQMQEEEQQQQQQPGWQLQLNALHVMLELPGASRHPTEPHLLSELLQQAVVGGAAQQLIEVLVRELSAVDGLDAAAVAALVKAGVVVVRVLPPA